MTTDVVSVSDREIVVITVGESGPGLAAGPAGPQGPMGAPGIDGEEGGGIGTR